MNKYKQQKLNIFKKHSYKVYYFLNLIFSRFVCLPLAFICLLFCLFSNAFINSFIIKKANASAYTTYIYAQVKSDDTYLYKTPSNATVQNAYFALPNTYFVMLLSNYNDYFYKVQYRDLVGFVLKQKVFPIKEKPTTPYLQNITFRVYSSDGTKVYSSPFNTKDITPTTSVQVFETLNYYGYILGDELIQNRGLVWYYAKTQQSNTNPSPQESNEEAKLISGYFYSGLCDSLSYIPPNNEKVTYTNNVFLEEDNSFLFALIDLSPTLKILLVTLICLPSIGLVYLLFKPFKIEKEKLLKNKKLNLKNKQNKNKTQTEKNKHSRNAKTNKKVLQKFKTKRKLKNKNATINKIHKIIDDDIL